MRAVFLDLDSMHPADLELDQLRATVDEWEFHAETDARSVARRIEYADIVVANKAPLARDALLGAKQLKLVCVAATGTNNVDINAASNAGIAVSNARNYATPSVTEAVFTLLLTLVRQLDCYRTRVDRGDWPKSPYFCMYDTPIGELNGKKLGIVGYGALGRSVGRLAQCFGMQVLVCQHLHAAPESGRVDFQTLLAESDVISLHCPLTEQTRNLIGRAELGSMKPDAILINTARGGIVDESALVDALRQGRIAGAGIDVLSEEPPPADNPLLKFRSPRLIVTPHVAWASRASRQRLVNEIIENIRAFKRGEIRNGVSSAN